MAVTTAGDIITKAFGVILVLGTQDVLSSGDEQTGLDALNVMLDSWRLERLFCYGQRQQSFPLVIGDGSYTIGTGGDFNTDRPIRLINAQIVFQTVSFPLTLITQEQYSTIPVKTLQGLPVALFYDTQFPLGIINLYPVPNLQPSSTLDISSYLEIQSFAATTDTIDLPPGYARALIYNLAIELAPLYAKAIPPETARIAFQAMRNVKRINYQMKPASFDAALQDPRNSGLPWGWWYSM